MVPESVRPVPPVDIEVNPTRAHASREFHDTSRLSSSSGTQTGIRTMTSRVHAQRAISRLLAVAAVIATAVPLPALAAGDGFPSFKHGEWEFTRRGENVPQHVQDLAVKECLDPGAAIREQNSMLEQAGCKFDPPRIAGKVFTYAAVCEIPNVGRTRSVSVLTRESDSAYSVEVTSEGVMNGKPMKSAETLIAKRVGACKKPKKK